MNSLKNIESTSYINSPLGVLKAFASNKGIVQLEFIDVESKKDLTEGLPNQHIELLASELKEYFDGTLRKFNTALNLQGTEFQKSVWSSLLNIPYGKTRSYQEQSEKLNNPKGIRAIASANGSNKIAIVVPCHRVIGKDGSLTGYAGGLHQKKWLLDHEAKNSGQPILFPFSNGSM